MSPSEPPPHHCPGCGVSLPHNPRYPWCFCNDCLAKATDGQGRRLAFGNAALSGGLNWSTPDDPTLGGKDVGAVACLIHDREVFVTERRFGGVVAQPINRPLLSDAIGRSGVDLTRLPPK